MSSVDDDSRKVEENKQLQIEAIKQRDDNDCMRATCTEICAFTFTRGPFSIMALSELLNHDR